MEEKRNRLLVLLQHLRHIRKQASRPYHFNLSTFLMMTFEAYMLAGEEFLVRTGDYHGQGLAFEAHEQKSKSYFFRARWGTERQKRDFLQLIDECIIFTQQRIIDLSYEQDNKQ